MSHADESLNKPTVVVNRWSSLRYRLLLLLAVILVVILLVNGSSLYLFISRSEQALWQSREVETARFSANTVAEFIQRTENALLLAGLPDQDTIEANPQLLAGLLAENEALLEVVRLNERGRVLASAHQPQSPPLLATLITIPQSTWFGNALGGQTYLGDVQVSEGQPYVIMAIPTGHGGVVAGRLEMDRLWRLVAGLSFGETGQTYVINQRGRVVAHTDPEVALQRKSLEDRPELTALLAAPDKQWSGRYFNFAGQAVAGSTAAVAGTKWIVITEVAQSELTEVSREALGVLGGLTLIIGVVAGIVTTALLRRLLFRPLARLQTGAEQIGQGDLDYQLTMERGDEIGQVAQVFNQMTAQLRAFYADLAARGERLEQVSVLGQRLNAILEFETLLETLVNQVKQTFNYYHVQVYLLDEAGENLLMAAGVGEAGAEMKAAGHHISLAAPTSLVARAARDQAVVRADNVQAVPDWLPNPLLPDTRSEMAVPILLEDRVVGVLDVQADQMAGLGDEDANLLRLVANQVAVAVRNAGQFAEVRAALAEARALQERYLHQAWQGGTIRKPDYAVQLPGTTALPQAVQEHLKQAAMQSERPATLAGSMQLADEAAPIDYTALVASIRLQNQVIGAIELHQLDAERRWSEQEQAFVQAVADQVAQTAESLRLFEETRTQADFERLAGEITQKLRQAPNLESLVEVAAQELGQVLNVPHSVVNLGLGTQAHPDAENRNGS